MGVSEDIQKKLSETVEQLTVAISTTVLDELVAANPKDTEHSANNWVPSIRKPFNRVDGSRKRPSNAAQEAGRQELKSYRLSDGAIFITNNVNYLIWLVLGHSDQAPPGWDRFAIEVGIEKGAKKIEGDGRL